MTESDDQPAGAPPKDSAKEAERTPAPQARTPPPEGRTPPPEVMSSESTKATSSSTPSPDARAALTPEERLPLLEAEKLEMRERMLRIAAEFENYKKRARRDQADSETKGKQAVLRDILEVIDNLERAMAASGESADAKGILEGVTLVLRLFQSKLERHEVRAIDSKGLPFDPRVHDAISRVPSADVAPGTVLSELQRGYRIGDRLLRPASVVVAVAPPAAATPAPETDGAPPPAAPAPDNGGGAVEG